MSASRDTNWRDVISTGSRPAAHLETEVGLLSLLCTHPQFIANMAALGALHHGIALAKNLPYTEFDWKDPNLVTHHIEWAVKGTQPDLDQGLGGDVAESPSVRVSSFLTNHHDLPLSSLCMIRKMVLAHSDYKLQGVKVRIRAGRRYWTMLIINLTL